MMLPMTSRLISTKAEVRYNEIDRLFESTITEIFDYEQTEGGAKVEAEKEWLYDINLCELGVLYDFAYKDKEGFAIIIDDGDVKVTEIYTEGKNPYSKENVKNVYVSNKNGGKKTNCRRKSKKEVKKIKKLKRP